MNTLMWRHTCQCKHAYKRTHIHTHTHMDALKASEIMPQNKTKQKPKPISTWEGSMCVCMCVNARTCEYLCACVYIMWVSIHFLRSLICWTTSKKKNRYAPQTFSRETCCVRPTSEHNQLWLWAGPQSSNRNISQEMTQVESPLSRLFTGADQYFISSI